MLVRKWRLWLRVGGVGWGLLQVEALAFQFRQQVGGRAVGQQLGRLLLLLLLFRGGEGCAWVRFGRGGGCGCGGAGIDGRVSLEREGEQGGGRVVEG